jgi:negative regulator of sigma E activity
MAFIVFWNIESKFDMQKYMQKLVDQKRCSRAVYLNGRVAEVVIRGDQI